MQDFSKIILLSGWKAIQEFIDIDINLK